MKARTEFFALRLVAALCLLLAPDVAAERPAADAGPGPTSTATREGRLRVFDDVWETVRDFYYDPALGGVDWARVRERFRARAAEARGAAEFYAVLRRALAELGDPHTRVFAPGEGSDWRAPRYVSAGVRLRELEGEPVAYEVERGSEAERAGVRAGDALVSVDGEPAAAALTRRAAEYAPEADTARPRAAKVARLRAAASLFDGPEGSTFTAVFRDAGGGERRARLVRRQVTRAPEFVVRRAGGGAAVVRFNVFTAETAAALARALRGELKGARSLVIDLRDNGGGDAEAMTDVASMLVAPGRPLGAFSDRAGRVQLEPRTRASLLSTAEAPARFAGPVVVLTGPRTASAAEVFAAAMRESGRALSLVGEATCGCVLGVRRRRALPDGGTLDVSEMDFRTASGRRLEGAGVDPDVRAAPTRRSLREGKDLALERAFEVLKVAGKGAAH